MRQRFYIAFSLLAFLLLFWWIGHFEIFGMRPQGPHQWRQADCLSYTLNYYKEDISFWEPRVHNLGEDGQGLAVSEFPIVYFSVSRLWRLFGQQEWMYRLIVFLFSFLGLIALWRWATAYVGRWWSLGIALMLACSPIFAYYSNNFLMNVPALSTALMAIFSFDKFRKEGRIRWLISSMILFSLSGLLKVTGLLGYFSIMGYVLLVWTGILSDVRLKMRKTFLIIAFLLLPTVINLWWYNWAMDYNENLDNGFFLLGILPIWEFNGAQISHVISSVWTHWLNQYQLPAAQFVQILMLISLIVWRKKLNPFLATLAFISSLGMLCFLLLFFQVFADHDYYMVEMLLVWVLIAICFVDLIYRQWAAKRVYFAIAAACVVLFGWSLVHVRQQMNFRYNTPWLNTHMKKNLVFENIEPWLREKGIDRTDPVLIWPERSINIPLYFADQKGWTRFNTGLEDLNSLNGLLERGLQYFIITEKELTEAAYLQPYLHAPMGQYEQVYLYDLRDLKDRIVPVEDLLNLHSESSKIHISARKDNAYFTACIAFFLTH